MADDWLKGFEATDPADANPPEQHTEKPWGPPGVMADAVRARWKGVKIPYIFGTAKNGGGGGGN